MCFVLRLFAWQTEDELDEACRHSVLVVVCKRCSELVKVLARCQVRGVVGQVVVVVWHWCWRWLVLLRVLLRWMR